MKRRADDLRSKTTTARRALWRLLFCVCLAAPPALVAARPVAAEITPLAAPDVTAASVYVQDASAGVPLMEKNADERRPPSSTTKIVTAQVVIDNAALDELVVVDGADLAGPDESQMGLLAGDTLTVEQLLEGALIPSGNDAARTLARHVGLKILAGAEGDPIARFVEEMNAYVASLGLEDTNFTNAEGLDDPSEYTSAHDLAVLGARAMRNKTISSIVDQTQLDVTSVGPEARVYLDPLTGGPKLNSNHLLEGGTEPMDGVHGLKTGTTPEGGANLVVAKWSPGGNRIIAVVMGSEIRYDELGAQVEGSDRRYDDMRTVLSAVESSYTWVDPAEEEQLPGLADELAAWQVQLRNGSAIVVAADASAPVTYRLELVPPGGEEKTAGRVLFFAGSDLLAERPLTYR